GGVSRARADDDVRALVPRDEALGQAQARVEALLSLPSPAQFFIVRGATGDEVLAREEALREALRPLEGAGELDGVLAVSSWVPSEARQRRNRALTARAREAAFEALREELDVSEPAPTPPLTVEAFLSTTAGRALAGLWGKTHSVVLLRRPSPRALEALPSLELKGVAFVDRTRAMSRVLGAWRLRMSELLVLGLAVVLAALAARFGRRAFVALVPTVLAMGLTLAVVSAFGPLTLFHCLGLWILLGTGVDYAIFLVEHPVGVHDEAWFSVGLGAASTFLSFGLLGLSTTAAIAGFGVTVGVGTLLVWALTPMLVDGAADAPR
ncbi:MAG: hypothetical protein INH41_25920, partial [Myxococcaceae bacterium]|nr:hypothetical protein [Myxococcaceae bacterium]